MYRPVSLKIKNIISHTNSFYEFQNGKAIIIVGLNHDNPSQRGNGSGKSALIESLALAYSGTSIRDVKVKELINNNAKDGEVELIQYNTITKKYLGIWRKFYSNTKSAECRIWSSNENKSVNDLKEQDPDEIRLADINSYNKFVFEEIGITKEDFFNFYLLVEENYLPFLRVSDLKKKEIINRFSGADNIDTLIPLVKEDSKAFDADIKAYSDEIVAEKARYDVYQKQIESLKLKDSTLAETKKQKIEELQLKVNKCDTDVVELEKKNKDEKLTLDAKLKEIQDFDFEKKRKDIKDKEDVIDKDIVRLNEENAAKKTKKSKVQDSFANEIKDIQTQETTKKNELATLQSELKEFEDFESDLNKQIADSVECPKCSHQFSIKNENFDTAEAKSQLPVIQQEIKTLKTSIEEVNTFLTKTLLTLKQGVNNKVIEQQEIIQQEITKNSEAISSHQEEKSKLSTELTNLTKAYNELDTQKDAIERRMTANNNEITSINKNKQLHLDEIKEVENYTIDKELEILEKSAADSLVIQTQLKELLEKEEIAKFQVDQWETNFKNFKSFIANQSILNIQDYTNLFLQQMGSDITIGLDGFSELASGKIKEAISVEVFRGGFSEGSYGKFSGGERGRVDICTIIAIQQLINLNCKNGGLDLLICDEILDQVDSLGLESIIQSCQNLDRTIMIVSQNEINALKDYTLKIEKRNKVSTFAA